MVPTFRMRCLTSARGPRASQALSNGLGEPTNIAKPNVRVLPRRMRSGAS